MAIPYHDQLHRRITTAILVLLSFIGTVSLLEAEPPQNARKHPADPPFEDGYVPPEQLDVPEGLEVELWATTPKLYNPVNIDVDEHGRIWVLEGMNYGPRNTLREGGDRVVVLEDTDQDGRADSSQVFVQDEQFETPMGVAVFGNRVLVSQPPAVHMYVDVNDNQKYDEDVDRHEKLLTGFDSYDHGHGLHEVTAGPDGRWYLTAGNQTVGTIKGTDGRTFHVGSWYNREDLAGKKSVDGHEYYGGSAYRMNPDGSGLQVVAHNMRNPVGWHVDSFGRYFNNDNDDPIASRGTWVMKYGNMGYASVHSGTRQFSADKKPWQDFASAHWHQQTPGAHPSGHIYDNRGAPAGLTVYENGALGSKYRGLVLSTEPQQRVVYGYRATRSGAGYNLKRSHFIEPATEAADTWFRPSDVTVGPDGAVYVCDWFDQRVGGHTWSDDKGRGAIYRITPEGEDPDHDQADLSSIQGMVDALKSPANNVRFLGFERLIQQGEDARPALEKLMENEHPYIAARALWPLAQLGENGRNTVRSVLTDETRSERMRVAAFRALQAAGHDTRSLAESLSTDSSPAVRREVALSMRDVPFKKSRTILLNIAERFNGEDRWYLEAFGTGASGKRTEVFQALQERTGPPEEWTWATARIVWRLRSPAAVDALETRALADIDQRHRRLAIDSLGYIYHETAARAMEKVARRLKSKALYDRAKWYLKHHGDFQWAEYDVQLPPSNSSSKRVSTLEKQSGDQFTGVTYLNAGATNNAAVSLSENSPRLTVKRGESYQWEVPYIDDVDTRSSSSGIYHDQSVILGISGLKPDRRYRLGLTWWDFDNGGRVQGVRIKAENRSRNLLSGVQLPDYEHAKQPPEHIQLPLPESFTSNGTVEVEVIKEGATNAVVNEAVLLQSEQNGTGEKETTGDAGAFEGTYPAPEQLASKQGDAERGKSLFFGRGTCSTCHRKGDRGRRFGPELSNLSKSKTSIIDSIINPSSAITHGYKATKVVKKDGSQVSGIPLSKDDPVVLETIGGNRRSIPRKEIKELRSMSESIMPSARQLRLRPQDVVDLASFLTGE